MKFTLMFKIDTISVLGYFTLDELLYMSTM